MNANSPSSGGVWHRFRRRPAFGCLALVQLFLAAQFVTAPPAAAGPSFVSTFERAANGVDLHNPNGVAIDPDQPTDLVVFVADTPNQRIVKFVNGKAKFAFGIGPPKFADGHTPEDGMLYYPQALTVFGGEVYVADTADNRIQVFGASDGAFHRGWGTEGSSSGQFSWPTGIAISSSTGTLAVVDSRNKRVTTFRTDGTFVKSFGTPGTGPGQFVNPIGIVYNDLFYVTDGYENWARVQAFSSDGTFAFEFGSYGDQLGQMEFPIGISADNDGNVYVAESGNTNRIQKFTPQGRPLWTLGGPESGEGFSHPDGVAADLSGNGDFIVADTGASRILEFTDRQPDLKLVFRGLGSDNAAYQVEYNQAEKTCQGSLKSTFTFPSGRVIKASKHIEFSDSGKLVRIDLERDEVKDIHKAANDGKRIKGESTVTAKCSDDEVVSKTINYRVS